MRRGLAIEPELLRLVRLLLSTREKKRELVVHLRCTDPERGRVRVQHTRIRRRERSSVRMSPALWSCEPHVAAATARCAHLQCAAALRWKSSTAQRRGPGGMVARALVGCRGGGKGQRRPSAAGRGPRRHECHGGVPRPDGRCGLDEVARHLVPETVS